MAQPFFIGRLYDVAQGKLSDQPLDYEPANLTTHAVVTGMTGSGKTGLCITLMEEAALQGIPALLIDPKGDLTNLLLHFPDLAPQDFQPWLDPEMAQRAGKSIEEAASDTAQAWRDGLGHWGIGRERILALKNAADFAVFTPGSDAGIPVSVLSSLAPPGLDWATNREVLTERISSTVTAILGLVGFEDIDPVRSREHILMANIFQHAWSRGVPLDLSELILQIQSPPFDKLGAFPVETFFPAKERMALALQLNNILASPSFELWREGHPLDITSLLWAPDGRPRHSVFYLAHLSDQERMFFVTLLLSAVETWMRTQAGATTIRALLYMDELYGYLPPQRNPSSKQPMLRLLKQARAFGLGLVLATQNPVDVDYKGLSNAGTWFIGKLQTDQDKQRLLDGLESADGILDRSAIDRLISSLGKRIFIMHNVHQKQPVIFQTRWAMNFLAGPLTRTQIPALNKLVGADVSFASGDHPGAQGSLTAQLDNVAIAPVESAQEAKPQDRGESGSQTRPTVPAGIAEHFLPVNTSFTKAVAEVQLPVPDEALLDGMLYRPVLVAAAQVRFLDRKYGVDSEKGFSVLIPNPDKRGVIRWEGTSSSLPSSSDLDPGPDPQGRFASLEAPFTDARLFASMQRDFAEWVYRSAELVVRGNEVLGIYATPDVSQAELIKACSEAAREARDTEINKVTASIDKQIKTLNDKISREERELHMDETELQQRKGEEIATHAENVLGVFGGRRSSRRLSSSLTKRRLTEQAKADVEESVGALGQYKKQLTELEVSRQQVVADINAKWGDIVNDIIEIPLKPTKTNIFVSLFGLAWLPFYLVKSGHETVEVPAFAKPG
ncbi:MAG: DUF87 domain-containing protein [Chloroflexota bacterium]